MSSGTNPSLDNCQYQTYLAKASLRIEDPRPYKCRVSDDTKAGVTGINKTISLFNL